MIAPTLLLFVAVLLPLSAHADIHKCQIGNDTLYQEDACPGVQVPMTRGNAMIYQSPDLRALRRVLPPPPQPRPQANRSTSSAGYRSSVTERNDRVRAQARGELIPGMTKGQVYAMLGEPDYGSDFVNSDGEKCHNWVWINPRFLDKRRYRAIICNGLVTGR
ncbi:hypothetical protein [Halomonas getboli]|uniref:hypothetical protein n=1 Tax=Halomonas getboli TaxID=2935862 RepID=UPI001FFF19ED|nr:hypothetical protein [Halomonas getboli]MCK2183857.1 hypothetical protein [Halomonas getboli]